MSILVWAMMGIAVWHFTVFLPDRFWGGIVGAFLVATVGSMLFGYLANGLDVPGGNTPGLIQAVIAIPGGVLALAASYFYGARYDRAHGVDHGFTHAGSR